MGDVADKTLQLGTLCIQPLFTRLNRLIKSEQAMIEFREKRVFVRSCRRRLASEDAVKRAHERIGKTREPLLKKAQKKRLPKEHARTHERERQQHAPVACPARKEHAADRQHPCSKGEKACKHFSHSVSPPIH